MSKIDFEEERRIIDREITYFHFKRARRRILKCIKACSCGDDAFFLNYFHAQEEILGGHFRLAIHYIDKALAIRPWDGCAYNDRALCLADLDESELALKWFDQGIAQDVNCVALYHNKGWLLNSLGRHRSAIVCFHKALELDPRRPEALYSLADSYAHLDDLGRARRYFKKALLGVLGHSSYMRRVISQRIKSLEK